MGLVLFPEGKDNLGEPCAGQWCAPMDNLGAIVEDTIIVTE